MLADISRASHYYSAGLTGLRGFAALWVFIYHMWVAAVPRSIKIETDNWSVDLTPFFSTGWAGVDILFTLSGFLLSLPLIDIAIHRNQDLDFGRYFKRRVLRVIPAYYFQFSILLLFIITTEERLPEYWNIILHGIMLHNLSQEYYSSINSVWYTLPIEFSFYLLLPFLILLLKQTHWLLVCVLTIGATISYRYYIYQWAINDPIHLKVWALEQLPGRLDQFAMGTLTAYLFLRIKHFVFVQYSMLNNILLILGLGGMIALIYVLHIMFTAYWEGHFLLFTWHGVFSIFTCMVIYSVASRSSLGTKLFVGRWMLFSGIISYSLYLWHYPLVLWIANLPLILSSDDYTFPIIMLIATPICLLTATLSYLFVERPFLNLKTHPV